MLRRRADLQSLAYLVALPALLAWQWHHGFSWPLYLGALWLSVGVSVINHNHAHLPMWRLRALNRITDFVLTLAQGHPIFAFQPAHRANHHRHHHGPRDVARTYRFGGDSNHLWGYLVHPAHAVRVLYPLFLDHLACMRRRAPGVWRYYLLQYAALFALWAVLAAISPGKTLLYVLLPQLHGLHWLLATNYLQHAHADGHSRINFARNFEGAVNRCYFNIGLHTAHHLNPRTHWSELPRLHRTLRPLIDARLLEPGLLPYMARSLVLSPFLPRWRSRSLMHPPES